MKGLCEELLVQHCAPTLAGMKTGSLFSCRCESECELHGRVRDLNRRLVPKGLRVLPLCRKDRRALIYLYRPGQLDADLSHPIAEGLLSERGYPCGNANRCLVQLMSRLAERGDFPHEIGLFLGYPPVDVEGFIRCGAKCCKCVGDWRVYGDEAEARRLFDRYRRCTAVYCEQLSRGRSVEQLAVRA